MVGIFIVLLVIAVILYKFNQDRQTERKNIELLGGLDKLYPNFANSVLKLNDKVRDNEFTIITNLMTKDDTMLWPAYWEATKLTPNEFQFKQIWLMFGVLVGSLTFTLERDFKTKVVLFFNNTQGKPVIGYERKFIDNNDLSVEQYLVAFTALLEKVTKSGKIQELPEYKLIEQKVFEYNKP